MPAVGAVFISAYTIGSGARDAGVLGTAQATSAGHTAFLTAWVIGLIVLVGAFFVRRTPGPAADETAAAAPVGGEAAGGEATTEGTALPALSEHA